MSVFSEFLAVFGIRNTPWIVRVYLTLLSVCVGLMLFAVVHSPGNLTADHPAAKLLSLAMDSFKIVLGAVIGSLSMATHAQFGQSGGGPTTDGKPKSGD